MQAVLHSPELVGRIQRNVVSYGVNVFILLKFCADCTLLSLV